MPSYISDQHLYKFGGSTVEGGKCSPSKLIQRYNHINDTWENQDGQLPVPMSDMACTLVGKKVYISGGLTQTDDKKDVTVSDKVVCFESETGKIAMLAPLLHPHMRHTMSYITDHLIVMGGEQQGATIQTTFLMYSMETEQWTEISAPNNTFFFGKGFGIGPDLYILAHKVNSKPEYIGNFLKYNHNTNKWKQTMIQTYAPICHFCDVMDLSENIFLH